MMDIREKSLNEIYGWEPMKPELDTYVLRTAARAMRLPLKDLSAEEIRLLIGQKVGLQYLLPLAIEILRKNPLKQASMFPGDLLAVCKRLDPADWNENPVELRAFQNILKAAEPKTVTEFATPCGVLRFRDDKGNILPFQIRQEIWEEDASVYDNIAGKWVPLDSQDQYSVCIPARDLTVGSEYEMRLYGDYNYTYGDSDECAVASLVTADDVTLSLGACDLNEDEKNRQAVPDFVDGERQGWHYPETFVTSKMSGYLLFVLPDWSGYRFRLLDDTVSEIRFRLAWVPHNIEYAEPEDYAAVTNWTIM